MEINNIPALNEGDNCIDVYGIKLLDYCSIKRHFVNGGKDVALTDNGEKSHSLKI